MGKKSKGKKGRKQTLTEFYNDTFLPLWIKQKKLDPKTESGYVETLKHFVDIIGDKQLRKITDLDMAKFMDKLGQRPGKKPGSTMADNSMGKHARNVATLLKAAGPRNQSNPLGQDLIKKVPCIVIPRCRKDPPKVVWTVDEIRALYDAAQQMTKPVIDGIPAWQWWQSFICVLYYAGLRVDAAMRVEFSAIEGNTIVVPGSVSKGDKGITQYLHKEAIEHIDALRRPGRTKIFGWPNWSRSKGTAYGVFNSLVKAAGIPTNRVVKKFHAIRAVHSTEVWRVTAKDRLGIQLAQQSCGHSDSRVTLQHYLAGDLQSELHAEAINKLRSPCGKAAAAREAESNMSGEV